MSQSSQTSQHAGIPQTTAASQVNNLQIYMSQLSQLSHQGGQAFLEAAGNLECGTTDVNTCVPTVANVTSEKASMSSKPHYLGPDNEIRAMLSKFGATSRVELQVVGTVLWGVPEST